MDSLKNWYPDFDENGNRCQEYKFVEKRRTYPSKWDVLRSLTESRYGSWFGFFQKDSFFDNLKILESPYPEMRLLEYGCYDMFTESEPDRRYTVNRDEDDKLVWTEDENGEFLVFQTHLKEGTTWLELFIKTDELINRVQDCQHNGVNSFKENHNGCFQESNRVLELIMDS